MIKSNNCKRCTDFIDKKCDGNATNCICKSCPRNLAQCRIVKYCRETESILYFDEW